MAPGTFLPWRKVYSYQKGDFETMRKDLLRFAKERYFNGHSDARSVQENFNLIKSFIHDSADKHIPSKISKSVSTIPWITPEIKRFIEGIKFMLRAKMTGSGKLWTKFESLRREIKADIKKQHDLYVKNLVHDVKADPRDFYRYINNNKILIGQFNDAFNKTEYNEVWLTRWLADDWPLS